MATKKEVFDYVMSSPENTNPSVLKSVLGDLKEKVVVKCVLDDGNVKLQDEMYGVLFYQDVCENLKKGVITELEVYDGDQYYCSLVANFYYITNLMIGKKYGMIFSGAMLDSNTPKILYLDWSNNLYYPSSLDTPLHIVSTN